jgi:hypothetical protein
MTASRVTYAGTGRRCLKLGLVLLACACDVGADPPRAPKPGHPILGTWSLEVPGTECEETYFMRQDGTSVVTSGEELGQSAYEIADAPSDKGFYKTTDRITQDNGKLDCVGKVSKIGDQVVLYIRFHPSGQMMIMCRDESLQDCIGPFYRVGGESS